MSPFEQVNTRAIEFGEYGIDTMDESDMDKLIDLERANKLAEEQFGEFGFATLLEVEMEELINEHPELIRK